MRIKQRVQAQAPAKDSYAQPRSVLPSRPFSESKPGVAASAKQQVPDPKAENERAKPKGFHLGDVRMRNRSSRSNSTGRSLPEKLQGKMEAAFNTDFSSVRIQEDDKASRIGALAYTQGEDIHFAKGEYQPGSLSGEKLIGHELAHILQQRTGRAPVERQADTLNADPALEAEARTLGARAAERRESSDARAPLPAPLVLPQPSNVTSQSQNQPVQCAYRYDHVNKRFWKEDPNDEEPKDHPEDYEEVTTKPKLQLKSGAWESPKPPDEETLKGGKIAELFSRSEASMKRKVQRHDPEKIKKLTESIEKAPTKPSTSDPLFPGTSFFHQASVIEKAQPSVLKLKTYPKVYTNTRSLSEGSGEKRKISPPEMLVDPGGTYEDLRKDILPKIENINATLSKSNKRKEFFNYLDKPMNTMASLKPSPTPKKKQKVEVDKTPEEEPKDKAQREIDTSRELVGLKHLTMGVEGFRREGVHMANRLMIESQLKKDTPNLDVLIGEEGIMAPSVSTQWHFNPSVNEQQLKKFGSLAQTVKKLDKVPKTPLSDFISSLEELEKPIKDKDTKKIQKKRRLREKAVVKQLNRYSKQKEALTLIPSTDESESDDEDNPSSFQVSRQKGEVVNATKKRKSSKKKEKQPRLTKKAKTITADDSPEFKNFMEARKLPKKELEKLYLKANSVSKFRTALEKEKTLKMKPIHVQQLLFDKDIFYSKGFKKSDFD